MKALKVTLLLAIFCLTFSGQSADVNKTEKNDTFEPNKVEFKNLALSKCKTKAPKQA